MEAILYDGVKQLKGDLELGELGLEFFFKDFKESSLNLQIPYESIETTKQYKLFNKVNAGLRITTKEKKENIFILKNTDLEEISSIIRKKLLA